MNLGLTVKHCPKPALNRGVFAEHQRGEKAPHDQFRGALMGLALVPMALGVDAIAYHQTPVSTLMQTIAPGLLRHHNHRQQRQRWLKQTLFTDAAFTDAATALASPISMNQPYQQLLLIGDWLETIMTCQAIPSLLTNVEQGESPTGQPPDYQLSHLALMQAIVPESYGLSVQSMAQEVGLSPPYMPPPGLPYQFRHQPAHLMLAAMGLLAGACTGAASLPVLWQVGLAGAVPDKRATALSIADQLYRQWAGVLS